MWPASSGRVLLMVIMMLPEEEDEDEERKWIVTHGTEPADYRVN